MTALLVPFSGTGGRSCRYAPSPVFAWHTTDRCFGVTDNMLAYHRTSRWRPLSSWQISKIFEETADNEKEHAELWYKYLHGGKVADTPANLLDAASGENAEWTDMYARFAATTAHISNSWPRTAKLPLLAENC